DSFGLILRGLKIHRDIARPQAVEVAQDETHEADFLASGVAHQRTPLLQDKFVADFESAIVFADLEILSTGNDRREVLRPRFQLMLHCLAPFRAAGKNALRWPESRCTLRARRR